MNQKLTIIPSILLKKIKKIKKVEMKSQENEK